MTVPAVVDLHAADVEARPPLGEARLGEGQRLLVGLEPEALALAVDRPGPGAEVALVLAAGLVQGDGVEHLDRHAAAAGAVDDGAFAELGRVLGGRAPAPRARRSAAKRNARRGEPGRVDRLMGSGFSSGPLPAGLGPGGYQRDYRHAGGDSRRGILYAARTPNEEPAAWRKSGSPPDRNVGPGPRAAKARPVSSCLPGSLPCSATSSRSSTPTSPIPSATRRRRGCGRSCASTCGPRAGSWAGRSLSVLAVALLEVWLIWYAGRLVDVLGATPPAEVWVRHGVELAARRALHPLRPAADLGGERGRCSTSR